MRNRTLKFGDFPISNRDVVGLEVKRWAVGTEGYQQRLFLWLSSEDTFTAPNAYRFSFLIPEDTVLVAGEREADWWDWVRSKFSRIRFRKRLVGV